MQPRSTACIAADVALLPGPDRARGGDYPDRARLESWLQSAGRHPHPIALGLFDPVLDPVRGMPDAADNQWANRRWRWRRRAPCRGQQHADDGSRRNANERGRNAHTGLQVQGMVRLMNCSACSPSAKPIMARRLRANSSSCVAGPHDSPLARESWHRGLPPHRPPDRAGQRRFPAPGARRWSPASVPPPPSCSDPRAAVVGYLSPGGSVGASCARR